MSLSPPAIHSRKQAAARTRLARFSLIALFALLLAVTACGGGSGQSKAGTATSPRTYEEMVKDYDQQAGPQNEGFWNEVYQDAD